MKKFSAALALLAALSAAPLAMADTLSVDGLGAFPFEDVRVTDARGTAVLSMIRRSMESPKQQETKRTALLRFLTVPEGMRLRNETGASAIENLRVWQLVRDNAHGTYTMLVFAFSGDRETLFPKNAKKAADFWEHAFSGDADHLAKWDPVTKSVFLEDFRKEALAAAEDKSGDMPKLYILDASSWKPFHNEDGSVRWQQTVKFTLTGDDGFVTPSWYESVLYRTSAGRYYFLLFLGSHQSAEVLEDSILQALYRIERSGV